MTPRSASWERAAGPKGPALHLVGRVLLDPARFSWACRFAAAFLLCATVAGAQEPSSDSQKGKELYLKYSCYACHGYDGHGGAGARLVPLALTLERFTAYVHNPRRMPPYTEKVLTDAQLADLFAYIKSLPRSPAAQDIPLLTRIMKER